MVERQETERGRHATNTPGGATNEAKERTWGLKNESSHLREKEKGEVGAVFCCAFRLELCAMELRTQERRRGGGGGEGNGGEGVKGGERGRRAVFWGFLCSSRALAQAQIRVCFACLPSTTSIFSSSKKNFIAATRTPLFSPSPESERAFHRPAHTLCSASSPSHISHTHKRCILVLGCS